MEFLKNLSHEKKVFWTFLLVHLLVWSGIGLIRTVLPTDSLEGIFWGSLHDFGTPKHPPLAGWLTYLAYMPFKIDFSIYLMSQLFIVAGFVYIYNLARNFVDDNKAMLSVILLEGCWSYSYVTGYYGFNPDVILLFTLPVMCYYFYKCMKTDRPVDWIILGLVTGLSFLNKYQTALIALPLLIWAVVFKRDVFKQWKIYVSALLAFLIFLPHILWLVKYDFFPFLYFENELSATSWWNHITAPLLFFIMQIAVIAGSLVIYLITRLRYKQPFVIEKNYSKKDLVFILLVAFTPLLIHMGMGFMDGGTMRPRWGFEFWFMIGILLFYFFPYKVEKKQFDFMTKLSYVVMLIVFLSLGTLLTVEKNYRSRYPVGTVYNGLNAIWKQNVNSPMKYVGGYIEWTLPLTIYSEGHPTCMLDTFGYPSPWVDENDLKASGIMVIDRTVRELERDFRQACPYLPKDFKIDAKPYSFTLYNALKMPREYTIYYMIVPPMK